MRSLTTSTTALAFASKPAAVATPPAVAAKPGAPSGPRVAPVVSAAIKIDLPVRERKRGSSSSYPFDTLTEAGMAFGVKDKKAKNLSSVISNINKRFTKQIRDEAGNPLFETKIVAGADGAQITVPDTDKPKLTIERKFAALDVDADLAARIKGTALAGFDCLITRVI